MPVSSSSLHRASIPPVPAGTPRPLWSVMIPTYNCADYLRETLSSVLAQDPGPEHMQIEVVDDHSTEDDPKAVVTELGKDRVGFYRQPENVGFIRNFEACLKRARGRLVHLLHGDDYVRDGFYRRLQAAFEEHPDVGAAFCRHIYMDEQGHWQSLSPLERSDRGILEDWLPKIASGQRIATPSVVVRRAVYETLGGFDRRMFCAGEDWEMWVRIAAHYPVWFEPEPLAVYRMKRSGALTEQAGHTNRLVQDMRLATDIIGSYLPEHLPEQQADALLGQARQMYAHWALEAAEQMLTEGKPAGAVAQARLALHCSRSPAVVRSTLRLFAGEAVRWTGRKARSAATSLARRAASFLKARNARP